MPREPRPFRPLEVIVAPGDSFERALKKFSRLVREDGILAEHTARLRGLPFRPRTKKFKKQNER